MNKRIDNYSIMIASKYFERIDDFINLEIGARRFKGNMERFHFNPIPLNKRTRKFFTNLETLHLFYKNDQIFNDGKIFKQCIWYYVNHLTYLKEEEKGNDCKYWKNNIDHKGILERKNIIDLDEMNQIEEWSGMKIENIMFDSDIHDWNRYTSVFGEKIKNKSNLIFVIEDEDNNKFGGYINAKIDNYYSYITDPKSFVFSLKSNGRLNGMFKFDITRNQHAFFLCHKSYSSVFAIGGLDIYLDNENNKNQSYCNQSSFNYNGIQNALCGNYNFTPKRITVIQLMPSLNNLDNNERKLIEEWTKMKIGNIIFDSTVDNWNIGTSIFNQKIMNKSNLIFLIEDDDNNKFGGYINAKIDKIEKAIKDSKSFVFSLNLNGMLKFDIIRPQFAFYLNDKSNECLFLIGDIYVWKGNKKNQSYCQQTSFNYNGMRNALCGKTYPHKFTPKRITVIQLI